VRFRPPLTLSEDELNLGLKIIHEAIKHSA
jgi:4-aminobutyrate aminotransferase-like enzyme